MMHSLPDLPYALDALAPHIGAETLEYHWGRHHRRYVDTLNELIGRTALMDLDLRELVRRSSGAVFDNAAQHFNHSLYWQSLSPQGGGEPGGVLGDAISRSYGSFAAFRREFAERAGSHFGSGWAWVVQKPDGAVRIDVTHDAGCPLTQDDSPLLTCDLWEHAYYIDYRNERPRYIEAFFELANWRHAEDCFRGFAPAMTSVPASLQAPGF